MGSLCKAGFAVEFLLYTADKGVDDADEWVSVKTVESIKSYV